LNVLKGRFTGSRTNLRTSLELAMSTVNVAASTARTSCESAIRDARLLVHDLFEHRQLYYWLDLIVTLSVGYTAAAIYLRSDPFSLPQLGGLIIASFALFRAGSYIHEITHMRKGEMTAFRVFWNLVCGVPMLTPSYFYENHIDHHKSHHYGTDRDGEYLPLGTSSFHAVLLFLAQCPLLPIYIFFRFLLAPLTFVTPRVRNWVLEHMSSFVINYRHRLAVPANAPRRWWTALEMLCCVRAWGLIVVVAVGLHDWTRMLQLYALSVSVLSLNYSRNLVAHHYRSGGRQMTHLEQLLDSVNLGGRWSWTELFFPLGLRYHALHHLFPSLPFHNMGIAHRRLMAELPADSPYRETVYPSYWAVIKELWADTRKAAADHRSAIEPPGSAAA
jgi:fatty acid desaturase